jgi:hypothetical protein
MTMPLIIMNAGLRERSDMRRPRTSLGARFWMTAVAAIMAALNVAAMKNWTTPNQTRERVAPQAMSSRELPNIPSRNIQPLYLKSRAKESP